MTPSPDSTATLKHPLYTTIIVLGSLIVLLNVALALERYVPAMRQRFEYQIIAPADDILENEVNRLGREGWEVVSARRATSGYGTTTTAAYELILQRPTRTWWWPRQ